MKRSRLLSILLAMTMVFTMIPAGMIAEPEDVAEPVVAENNEGSAPEENPAPAEAPAPAADPAPAQDPAPAADPAPAEEPSEEEPAEVVNPAPAGDLDEEQEPAPAAAPAQADESEGGEEEPAPAAEPVEGEPSEEGEPVGEEPAAEGEEPEGEGEDSEEEIPEFVIDGEKLVKYNGEAEEVTVPDGIKVIGSKAFYENKTIKKVILPDSVEEIAGSAFEKCSNLEQVVIGAESKLAKIGANAFANDKKLDVTFAENVENVDETAFYKAEETEEEGTEEGSEPEGEPAPAEPAVIAEEYIPGDVIDDIEDEEPEAPAEEFDISGDKLVSYNWAEGTVSIPEGIKVIGKQAFKGNKNIVKVILPDSVETIGTSAFENCTNLEQVVIGANSNLSRIDWAAFKNDAKLDTSFAANVKTVAGNAFVEKVEEENEPEEVTGPEEGTTVTEGSEEKAEEGPEEESDSGESALDENEDELTTELIVGSGEITVSLQPMNEGTGTVPTIVTPPTNQTVTANGEQVTFTVTATDATSYQWQVNRNDGNGFVDLKENTLWHGTKKNTFYFAAGKGRDEVQYRVVVKNSAGQVESDPVSYSLQAAPVLPTITVPPTNQTVATNGDQVTFTVTATDATSYQWQVDRNDGNGFADLKDNTLWHGTKTNTFYFAAGKGRDEVQYRVVVRNDAGQVESDPVSYSLQVAPVLPTITVPPTNQTVTANGEQVTFTVTATDATSYQWQVDRNDGNGFVDLKDNTLWHGTKTNTFYFAAGKGRDEVQYRVIVRNDAGQVESDPVSYLVKVPPTITVPPTNQTVTANGEQVTFTVTATDAMSYQWQVDRNDGNGFVDLKDNTLWHGTKTNTFYFAAGKGRDEVQYRVVVSNDVGQVESDPVSYSLQAAPVLPTITVPPTNQTVAANGDQVTFTVTATDATSYQWQVDRNDGNGFVDLKDNTLWHGTKTDTFYFVAGTGRDQVQYRVVVKNSVGQVESTPVSYSLQAAPVLPTITVPPTNQTVAANGDQVTFTVTATDATSYQWQIDRNDGNGFVDLKENTLWHGTKTETFYFAAGTGRDQVQYRVVVKNSAGQVESDPVSYSLQAAPVLPTITVPPTNQTVVANGDQVTFTVTATDATSYQWQIDRNDGNGFVDLKENTLWHGTKTETFYFAAGTGRDQVQYRVVVKNSAGQVESDPVSYSLLVLPTITVPPTNQIVTANGDQVTFTVTATDATSYQWQIDRNDGNGFVNLSDDTVWHGTTTDTFYFIAGTGLDQAQYRVVVMNAAGQVESDPVSYSLENRTFVVDDVTYCILNDEQSVKVTGYTGSASALTIPSEPREGLTVTEVGASAFEGNTNLVSISLPNTITLIGEKAFKNCSNLSSMTTHD